MRKEDEKQEHASGIACSTIKTKQNYLSLLSVTTEAFRIWALI